MVSKHQDLGTTKETSESIKRSDKPESSNSINERRRKAMVVNETTENNESESSSSSSSSDDDSAEEEKGLLCLFSVEEESSEMCLMAQDEEVDSQSSSFLSLEMNSSNDQNSNESVSDMMRRFAIINSTYSELKEENSRLLISHNELRRVRIENIKLVIVKDQLEKQVLSLKE
ncbi:PREDICTED: ribosome assembly protein 3-like [Ipomoea nil]|uniref:ribosome assembly protein 3-like n=1 Tax=Ipomoea nil TaxID=35883 RepID=UPI0009016CE6|nr:PREDICTED: ribosome assembly protein 3-like [Ipomoea nil]